MILFARHFHMGHRDGDTFGKRLAEGLLLHKLYLHAIFMVRGKDRFGTIWTRRIASEMLVQALLLIGSE